MERAFNFTWYNILYVHNIWDTNIFILTEHVSYVRIFNRTNVPMRWSFEPRLTTWSADICKAKRVRVLEIVLTPSARPRDSTVQRAIRRAIQVIQHFLFQLFSIYINDIYVVVFVIYELLINIDKINGIG